MQPQPPIRAEGGRHAPQRRPAESEAGSRDVQVADLSGAGSSVWKHTNTKIHI